MSRLGLVWILVALLAGGAIGYVGGSAGGDVAVEQEERAPVAVRESAPEPTYAPPPPEAPVAADRDLENALSRVTLKEEEIELGDGAISGTVKDGEGAPLAGVLVRVTRYQQRKPEPRETSGAPPADKSLEEEVREMLRRRRFMERTRREATTDSQGRYRITGLSDEAHQIAAFKEGWTIRGAPGTPYYRVMPGATIDFIASEVVAVPMKVTMTDGTEPERATISAMSGQGNLSFVWTPDHRTIHLMPGEYRLKAVAGDKGEMKSPETDVEVAAAGPAPEVHLSLEDRTGIKGKVSSAVNWTWGTTMVAAVPVRPGEDPDPDRLLTAQKQAWVQPGVRAEFTFFDLSEGTWLVGVVADRREVLVQETVEVGEGIVEMEIEIPPPDDRNSILVRVEAPDGSLLREGSVLLGKTGGNRSGYPYYGSGKLEEDGTWRVQMTTPPGFDGMQAEPVGGAYFVEAYSAKYGRKRLELDAAPSGLVTIRFDEPGKLVVTLLDYAGSDYEGIVYLGLIPRHAAGSSPYYPYGLPGYGGGGGVREDGTQTFTPVAPGEYLLSVYVRSQGSSARPVSSENLSVKPGENRVSITLPPLYDLTVILPEAEGNRTCTLQVLGLAVRTGATTGLKKDGGRMLFSRLPPGRYVLTVTGGRVPEKMVVRVPGPEVVRFASQLFSAMLVTVDRPDGYLAEIGLKSGDLVVALDGVEFKDETHMQASLIEGRRKESVKLTVKRGRESLIVVADLAKIEKSAEAGGRWVASTR